MRSHGLAKIARRMKTARRKIIPRVICVGGVAHSKLVGRVVARTGSLANRTLIKTLIGKNRRKVINVETITHTGQGLRGLVNGDTAIAIVVTRRRAVEHAKGFYFATVEAYDLIAVLCFSAISVVHFILVV